MTEDAGGTTRQRIAGGRIKELELPIPPKAEQRRIVAKLEALSARLARAQAELARVPVMAKSLRTTVLWTAFDLNLARDARTQIVTVGNIAKITSGFGFPKHLQGKTAGEYCSSLCPARVCSSIGTAISVASKATNGLQFS